MLWQVPGVSETEEVGKRRGSWRKAGGDGVGEWSVKSSEGSQHVGTVVECRIGNGYMAKEESASSKSRQWHCFTILDILEGRWLLLLFK